MTHHCNGNTVNLERHRRVCSICAHEQCQEIEQAFITWRSPAAIAKDFGLSDRASVYRHAHALKLFDRRRKNVKAALERIIEQAGEVEVTGSAVVAAIQAYSKINAAGEWVDKVESINLHELFDRMSTHELDEYARTGSLPGWFQSAVPATSTVAEGEEKYGN